MNPVHMHLGSTMPIAAAEVYRLAVAGIAEIKDIRRRAVKEAVERSKDLRRKTWYGSTPAFNSEEEAMEHSPLVDAAKHVGYGDLAACEMCKRAAEYYIQLNQGYTLMNITLADFKAMV